MKIMLTAGILTLLHTSASLTGDLTAPVIPDSAKQFMPQSTASFSDGLLEVLRDLVLHARPDLKEASGICLCLVAIVMLVSLVGSMPGKTQSAADLAGCVAIGGVLLGAANSMIQLGVQSVGQITEYGKLLLPVMTTALAAQGGVSSSVALYTGTAFFNSLMASWITKILTPMIYLFLGLSIACACLGEDMLIRLRDGLKWLMTWLLKTAMYTFTGYIGITGVVSGTTDAAALKAAKLTISGVVPVVGGILSDASEAVLVGVGTAKNAAGLYGIFAILAMFLGPFLRIGAHYLLIKGTSVICSVFGNKRTAGLIMDFSSAMGLVLAMNGAVSIMLLISVVCYMKGVI